MENLKLVVPTMEYKGQVMDYRTECFNHNEFHLSGCAGLEDVQSYEEWIDFENRLSSKYGTSYVPSSVFLAVRNDDNKVVGIIDIRQKLSEFLLKYGGHIGYGVLPSERLKGYAKQMLKLALEECIKLGIDRVLITCDKNNVGSYKTILANGGVLENEVKDDVNLGKSGIIQRYWITLNTIKICKILDEDIGEKSIQMDNPQIRYGARGIVLREDGKIAVFNKSNKNEYKLPGGGIEGNEKSQEAFKREVLEETGCVIEVIKELGIAEEYKTLGNFKQISYVFVGKVLEDTNNLNVTQKEKDEGAKLIWETPSNALKLITDCYDNLISSKYENVYFTKFIVLRDKAILEYYLKK